jgi:nitrogen fixation NifU-like protein
MTSQPPDSAELDDLYQEIILDHYRNPRNQERLEGASIEAEGINPFCGDEVLLQLALRNGLVGDVSFKGTGCSISQASASILTDLVKGKTLKEIEDIYSVFRDMMYGKDLSEKKRDELREAASLAGVRKFPIRIKCALLAWTTLEEGIKEHEKSGEAGGRFTF